MTRSALRTFTLLGLLIAVLWHIGQSANANSLNTQTPPSHTATATIQVAQGSNTLVPIAVQHLNRLVTPFANPQIRTTSQAQTDIKANVIYIATTHTAPISLFILPEGNEQHALSITLVPKRIPPQTITLTTPHSVSAMPVDNPIAKRWETSHDYPQQLTELFRTLVMGDIPPGYSLSNIPTPMQLPHCQQQGLTFSFAQGQWLRGHHLSVFVGTVTNHSTQIVALQEQQCQVPQLAGVAAWPQHTLRPGERSELFIAVNTPRSQRRQQQRPSLMAHGATLGQPSTQEQAHD